MPLYYDTPPAGNPVDLTELKDHLRIGDGTDYDAELQLLIDAMTDKDDIDNPAQFAYRRQFIEATLIFTLSRFRTEHILTRPVAHRIDEHRENEQRKIEIPRPPLISVTSLEYRDSEGVWQTVDSSNYEVNANADPGYIRINNDFEWPDFLENEEYPVRITYKAGYQGSDGSGGIQSTFAEVPANIRLWIMNHIGNYFTERKAELITNMDVVELKASMGRLMAPHNAAGRFG